MIKKRLRLNAEPKITIQYKIGMEIALYSAFIVFYIFDKNLIIYILSKKIYIQVYIYIYIYIYIYTSTCM